MHFNLALHKYICYWKWKRQSSAQLAPRISQSWTLPASCAMPVLHSLSSSSVFGTVFFPFSCQSFHLFEKRLQDSRVLHPFPLYSCTCCRSFSFRFPWVCSLTESKAESGSMEPFAKTTFFCIFHWGTQSLLFWKDSHKLLNPPALKSFLIYKREFRAAVEK